MEKYTVEQIMNAMKNADLFKTYSEKQQYKVLVELFLKSEDYKVLPEEEFIFEEIWSRHPMKKPNQPGGIIELIKYYRAATLCDLKEAKDIVEKYVAKKFTMEEYHKAYVENGLNSKDWWPKISQVEDNMANLDRQTYVNRPTLAE